MKKRLIMIMGLLCTVLAGAVIYLQVSEDDTAPVITYPEGEFVYKSSDSYEKLLEQVTATDDADGDVTESLVVENIYPNANQSTATVIYVARDSSNNIGKKKRIVSYIDVNRDKTESQDQAVSNENLIEDTTNDPAANHLPGQAENAPVTDPTSEDTEDTSVAQNLPQGSPVITLKETEVTIAKGESINRITYVESITDDKDDSNYLWQNIQITGDAFDNHTVGSYEQIYYVVDSDGNRSNEVRLVIHVR